MFLLRNEIFFNYLINSDCTRKVVFLQAQITEKEEEVEEDRETGSLNKSLYLKYLMLGLGKNVE